MQNKTDDSSAPLNVYFALIIIRNVNENCGGKKYYVLVENDCDKFILSKIK